MHIFKYCATTMDGVYPPTNCYKQPITCKDGKTMSYTGGTWVSSGYLRDRGQTSFPTEIYDEGWPGYLVNNPPPSLLYVRAAPSQYDKSKMVFWINGWERPRLVLTRGKKYQFNILTAGHPFYFSSLDGKPVTDIPPTDYYVTTITVDQNMPCEFKYDCNIHPGMGGKIIVKN